MRILLTGATGYIGKRLLPELIEKGHHIICCVRDKKRFPDHLKHDDVEVIEIDFLRKESLQHLPYTIDAAYYLVHSMSSSTKNFEKLEEDSAANFKNAIDNTSCKQVIYLSGIVNEDKLSRHLRSRKKVEEILAEGNYNLTTLRAGIIVGSGSASFEIIRDLVEKLPIMVTPKWLNTRSQPVAISDVIVYLKKVLDKEETYDQSFDIGGPEILTYKEMLLQYASVRKLKRTIITLPVMTPRLSSYWLYFVTATSYKLAVNLVNSMKVEVICKPNQLNELLNIRPLSYKDAIKRAFSRIEKSDIPSSWKDALTSGRLSPISADYIDVPIHGCLIDKRKKALSDQKKTTDKIWAIGGNNGWYYANFLWRIRGELDKLLGGVGLRRGRTNQDKLNTGDALDFWRVIIADKSKPRLLLFAEMKVPGEAWLEFTIDSKNNLVQTATFRPKGLWGRVYWYLMLPFHSIIFAGMLNKIVS